MKCSFEIIATRQYLSKVKILGTGKITKKIVVENCKISKSAKEAIEKAGGKITN